MMLNHRQDLKLTNAQVERLDSLAAIQERSMERFTPLVMRGMAELVEASSGNIDVNAARVAHNRIAAAHDATVEAGRGLERLFEQSCKIFFGVGCLSHEAHNTFLAGHPVPHDRGRPMPGLWRRRRRSGSRRR